MAAQPDRFDRLPERSAAADFDDMVHAAAGGTGLLLVQMAKMRGARVFGTASTPEKARIAEEAGADAVIDYTTRDFAAEARRLTNGRGVNAVYDSV